MIKDEGRLKVIENIENAIKENNLNRKVEEGDPVLTPEDRRNIIVNFDILKKKYSNRKMAEIARKTANKITMKINEDTEIIGLEKIQNLDTGAIITCNHFSKFDNTVPRYCLEKIGRGEDLYILVQETNMLMSGKLGWLLKNCYTIPISSNFEYNTNNFLPCLDKLMEDKCMLLIYPEMEMWYNYRKPRTPKIGAYHYACRYNVPVVPFFIEIINREEVGEDGFYGIKFRLHILDLIYPDMSKDFRKRKEEMRRIDFEQRVKKYEEVYSRQYEEEFCLEKDIAGWVVE